MPITHLAGAHLGEKARQTSESKRGPTFGQHGGGTLVSRPQRAAHETTGAPVRKPVSKPARVIDVTPVRTRPQSAAVTRMLAQREAQSAALTARYAEDSEATEASATDSVESALVTLIDAVEHWQTEGTVALGMRGMMLATLSTWHAFIAD
jgi:hypothetical protein